jgi:hypothetical protein
MSPSPSPLTGVVFAAALLLLATGGTKLLRPDGTATALVQAGFLRLPSLRRPLSPSRAVSPSRALSLSKGPRLAARLLGVTELVLGAGVVALGGPAMAAALAAIYLGFTAFVLAALLSTPLGGRPGRIRSCGCAGADAPPTVAHVVVTGVFAGCAAVAAALGGVSSLAGVWATAGPVEGGVLLGFAGIAAVLAWAVIAVLPLTRRAVAQAPGQASA